MTIRDIFVVDQLGTEWLMNKFLELCIISLVLNFYRGEQLFWPALKI